MTHTTSHINEPFNLGGLRLPNRLVQAPMAGISGRAFRLQARRFGAGLLTTEMVSSHGACYRNQRTQAMLELTEAEHPVAVQLFGASPDAMAEAARMAESSGADIIDINMGCPVRKVVKTGAGVALMGDEALAVSIAAAVVGAVQAPVTVKLRSGAGPAATALSLAGKLEATGVSALCIHPRLAGQGYKGKADHSLSRAMAQAASVPVIASGDIDGPPAAEELLAEGCAAVMIGRASQGNPWIFSDLLGGVAPHRRPIGIVLAELERFYNDMAAETGRERAVRQMRKFYGWYLKPFRPDAKLRDGLRRAEGFSQALELIAQSLAT